MFKKTQKCCSCGNFLMFCCCCFFVSLLKNLILMSKLHLGAVLQSYLNAMNVIGIIINDDLHDKDCFMEWASDTFI